MRRSALFSEPTTISHRTALSEIHLSMQYKPAFVLGTGALVSGFRSWRVQHVSRSTTCPRRSSPRASARLSMRAPEETYEAFRYSVAEAQTGAGAQNSGAGKSTFVDPAKMASVRKQMEFWFSPSNLRRDWYLRRQMDNDGWLDPALFLKFNRLKQLNASLEDIVDACRSSSLLEVSSPPADGSTFGDVLGQTRIRRSAELPPWSEQTLDEIQCSIVADNVPDDASVDSLKEIFEAYGEVTYVWISRSSGGDSKRHAIISYKSDDVAGSAVEAFQKDPPSNAGPITVKTKLLRDAIIARQKSSAVVVEVSGLSENLTWRDVWNEMSARAGAAEITVNYFFYKNGDTKCYLTFPENDTARRATDEICGTGMDVCGSTVTSRTLTDLEELDKYWEKALAQMIERKKRKLRSSNDYQEKSTGPPSGVIVRISGIPDSVGWKELKASLDHFGMIVFLFFQPQEDHCFVRFKDADTAEQAVAKISGPNPADLFGVQVEAVVLEGEDEQRYWKEAAANRRRKNASRAEERLVAESVNELES